MVFLCCSQKDGKSQMKYFLHIIHYRVAVVRGKERFFMWNFQKKKNSLIKNHLITILEMFTIVLAARLCQNFSKAK